MTLADLLGAVGPFLLPPLAFGFGVVGYLLLRVLTDTGSDSGAKSESESESG